MVDFLRDPLDYVVPTLSAAEAGADSDPRARNTWHARGCKRAVQLALDNSTPELCSDNTINSTRDADVARMIFVDF